MCAAPRGHGTLDGDGSALVYSSIEMRMPTIRVKALLDRAMLPGVTLVLANVAIVSCSSERPPSADPGGIGPGGSNGTTPDASSIEAAPASGVDAGGADDAEAGDGGADADLPHCLRDELVPDDAGATAVACPTNGPCSALCGHVVAHYKAGVAQAAVRCIHALPACESAFDVVPCVDQALARACPDPTSASYCSPLVSACDKNAGDGGSAISQAGCQSFAHGLSTEGRAVLAACIDAKVSAGTCPTEIVLCADQIRQ